MKKLLVGLIGLAILVTILFGGNSETINYDGARAELQFLSYNNNLKEQEISNEFIDYLMEHDDEFAERWSS